MPSNYCSPTNTAPGVPWSVETSHNLGRHFIVEDGGELILGAQQGGTLTLDGNVSFDFFDPTYTLEGVVRRRGGRRGGIAVLEGGILRINDGAILRNSRSGAGGAVRSWGHVFMTGGEMLHNVTDSANRLNGSGAAINITGPSAMLTMTGGHIHNNRTGNEEFPSATESPWGGGVRAIDGAVFIMNSANAYIRNNDAHVAGGVSICGTGSEFRMYNGIIEHNRTIHNSGGGGAKITSHAHFELMGGQIRYNTARANVGGVYLGHTSTVPGRATMHMSGGVIRNNTARDNAGGVGVMSADFIMTGGEIRHNIAGGMVDGLPGLNGNGGGVLVRSDSRDNPANPFYPANRNATFIMHGDNPILYDNTSVAGGGGVHLHVQTRTSAPDGAPFHILHLALLVSAHLS